MRGFSTTNLDKMQTRGGGVDPKSQKLCRHHLSTAQDGTAPNGNPIHVTNLKGTTAPNAGLYNSSLVQAFYGEHAGAGGERLLARLHVRADAGGEGPRPRHVVRRQVGRPPLLLQERKGGCLVKYYRARLKSGPQVRRIF